jgi:hypothetical protein
MSMKPKTLIISMICAFFLLGIILLILQFNFTDYSQLNSKTKDISKITTSRSEVKKTPEKILDVVSEKEEPQKYILSYEPNSDMVILTKKFADGSELITRVKSINPRFLEPGDVRALIDGIEFTNKEEMYMLIEDYSN